MELLRIAADNIRRLWSSLSIALCRLCMAGGLKDYKLEQDCFGRKGQAASQIHGGKAAYVLAPDTWPVQTASIILYHHNL